MTGPKWKIEDVPCPVCGQNTLVYDGSVKWRSGSRPPRLLARKDSLGSSPRADFEIAHYLHCTNCSTLLYDYMDIDEARLHIENVGKASTAVTKDMAEQAEEVEKVESQMDPETPERISKAKTQNLPRSETGWIAGSVGDISARIGYDVRDLIMDGYSQDEIDDVLYGRRTLEELLKSGPERRK